MLYNMNWLSIIFILLTYLLCTALFVILSLALTDYKDFKRADIKKRGWDSLRAGKLWMALAVSVVFTLISGGISSLSGGATSTFNFNNEVDVNDSAEIAVDSINDMVPYIGIFLIVFAIVMIIALIIGLCFTIFVTNILSVGLYRYFILNLRGRPEFKELFFGFTNGNYVKILKIMFKKTLYEFLWSLLFVIPGIVKSYEYLMIPYILAENPDIDEETAFRLSKEMMAGNKWRTYVLDMSFIGWELLCIFFTLGFGLYLLMPYIYATNASLYEKLRMNVSDDERNELLDEEMFGFKQVEAIETTVDL